MKNLILIIHYFLIDVKDNIFEPQINYKYIYKIKNV
jgi:hypothetical protein